MNTGKFADIKVNPIQTANNDTSELIGLLDFEGINFNLPSDYIEFIEQFGEGIIGERIRIFPVSKLRIMTERWLEWQSSTAEMRFFRRHSKKDSIMIGDTIDGDIIFYLNQNYYLAARQYEEKVYELGKELTGVFDFYKNDKKYGGNDITDFKPFDSYLIGMHLNSQKQITDKDSENAIMNFGKGILDLKEKAKDFSIYFTILEMNEERILNQKENKEAIAKYSKLAVTWMQAESMLDEIFQLISENYKDDLDWKLNYSELSKDEYYEEMRQRLWEQDQADRDTWSDYSEEGLNEFYEGYDETFLGID